MVVPLIGYVDRFSARPGERIEVKVSSTLGAPYHADLVRIIHADPNPAGPGMKMADVCASFAGDYPGHFQPTHSGSCGLVLPAAPLRLPEQATLCVRVQPWLLDGRTQAVLATRDGLALSIAADGAVLEMGSARCQVRGAVAGAALVRIAGHPRAGRARLLQTSLAIQLGQSAIPAKRRWMAASVRSTRSCSAPRSSMAAIPTTRFLNGRLEDPMILARRSRRCRDVGAGG